MQGSAGWSWPTRYANCLEWKRPGGGLKARECRDLLERLESQGVLRLPDKKSCGSSKPRKCIAPAEKGQVHSELTGSVEEFAPLDVELVESRQQRQLFQELLSRYHYLGYAMPYGARLQYLVYVRRPRREVVGCVQFSSPAWRMKVRDQWIGWDDATRKLRLQHIVNNSRLLVVARIRNLASMTLSGALKRLRADWQQQYGVALGWWRHWWTVSGFTGGVIVRPTGWFWEKPAAVDVWTGPTSVTEPR